MQQRRRLVGLLENVITKCIGTENDFYWFWKWPQISKHFSDVFQCKRNLLFCMFWNAWHSTMKCQPNMIDFNDLYAAGKRSSIYFPFFMFIEVARLKNSFMKFILLKDLCVACNVLILILKAFLLSLDKHVEVIVRLICLLFFKHFN